VRFNAIRMIKKPTTFAPIVVALALATSFGAYKVSAGTGSPSPVAPSPKAGGFADLVANVAAINRARVPADTLTPAALATAEKMAGSLPAGAESRSMQVFSSPPSGPVYALPAANGFAIVTGAGGGTVAGTLSDGNPIAGGVVYSSGSPGWLFGVASNDVASIDVIIGQATYKATLVGNGYYWVAPDASTDIRSATLLTHLKDGSVVRG
jgi:hypothetical protein